MTSNLCLTAPDVAALAENVTANGGRHRVEVIEAPPGFQLTFCQDPLGNPIELMNASYDRSVQAAA